MGLFNFVKDAGEKLWDAVTGQHDKDDQAKKVQEHLSKTGIPDADKVNIQIADGKATVTGDGLSQEAKEKILVCLRTRLMALRLWTPVLMRLTALTFRRTVITNGIGRGIIKNRQFAHNARGVPVA